MPVKNSTASNVSLGVASSTPKDYSMSREGVTQSLLSNMLSCPMAGMLALNRWHREDGVALTRFGSLFHCLLEQAYLCSSPPTLKEAYNILDEVRKDLKSEYGAREYQRSEYDNATAIVLWEAYRVYYAGDWEERKRIKTEQEFALPYTTSNGVEVILRGKIDGITTDKNGGVWLFEHKTRSRISDENLIKSLSIDLQVLMYCWAWQTLNPDQELLGVKYNVVRNPSIRGDVNDISGYMKKLSAHIAEDPTHYFHRFEIRVLPMQLRDFQKDLDAMLELFYAYANGRIRVFKNPTACNAPWPCSYLDACSSGCMCGYAQRPHLMPELAWWRNGAVG